MMTQCRQIRVVAPAAAAAEAAAAVLFIVEASKQQLRQLPPNARGCRPAL